jgi:hypothetical protein
MWRGVLRQGSRPSAARRRSQVMKIQSIEVETLCYAHPEETRVQHAEGSIGMRVTSLVHVHVSLNLIRLGSAYRIRRSFDSSSRITLPRFSLARMRTMSRAVGTRCIR